VFWRGTPKASRQPRGTPKGPELRNRPGFRAFLKSWRRSLAVPSRAASVASLGRAGAMPLPKTLKRGVSRAFWGGASPPPNPYGLGRRFTAAARPTATTVMA